MRPERDEYDTDDHRDDKAEETMDEHPGNEHGPYADSDGHQKAHLVPPRMKEAAQQADEQAENYQSDDVKHVLKLPDDADRETLARTKIATAA